MLFDVCLLLQGGLTWTDDIAGTGYSSVAMSLSHGNYSLYHTDAMEKFVAYVYGHSVETNPAGYGYATGYDSKCTPETYMYMITRFTHPLGIDSLNQSHSFTHHAHPRTQSITHPLNHTLNHSITHSTTHSTDTLNHTHSTTFIHSLILIHSINHTHTLIQPPLIESIAHILTYSLITN